MATMNISTGVSGLGTSNSWTTSSTSAAGENYGVTPYLGASISSASSAGWSLGAIVAGVSGTATLATSSGIAFTSTYVPTSWTTAGPYAPALVTGTEYPCTIYWTDSSGVQQFASGCPMTLTISAGTYTWACTGSKSPTYASAATGGTVTSATTTISNIIICPEVIVPAAIVADALSVNSISGLTVSSSRVGMVNFIGCCAAGSNGNATTTTFTFGPTTVGSTATVSTNHTLVLISTVTGLPGKYAVTSGVATPWLTVVCSSITTLTRAAWYAQLTTAANQTYVAQLVGPYAGLAWAGAYTSTSNPLYGLAQTAFACGAIAMSTADTSSAIAPAICVYEAS